jgi:hypothetical protein
LAGQGASRFDISEYRQLFSVRFERLLDLLRRCLPKKPIDRIVIMIEVCPLTLIIGSPRRPDWSGHLLKRERETPGSRIGILGCGADAAIDVLTCLGGAPQMMKSMVQHGGREPGKSHTGLGIKSSR